MTKNKKIEVKGTEITILRGDSEDFISLTDIARSQPAPLPIHCRWLHRPVLQD